MEDNITVNVGMPHAYTNLEIAEIVNRVYGNTTPIDYDDTRAETIKSSYMDIGRLTDLLGYYSLDMEEAIRELRDNQAK